MPVDIPAPADVKGLPMAVRISLRDSYGKPRSDLVKSVDKLSADLGLSAMLHLDWLAAWDKLKNPFKDEPQSFVPRLSDAATDLVNAVQIQADSDDAWGDKLLSEISQAGKQMLDLYVVVDSEVESPEPVWHPIDASITLRLPARPASSNVYTTHGKLVAPMKHIFETDSAGATDAATRVEKMIPFTAVIPEPPAAPSAPMPSRAEVAPPQAPQRMPTLVSIPRPSALSESTVPYFATIYFLEQRASIEVHGTHEPTMELLAEYMEKWAVPNPNVTTRVPYAKVERGKSAFGTGTVVVFVERSTGWGPAPTAVLPLQFLQGALGYSVMKTDGRIWVLRRDTPLLG